MAHSTFGIRFMVRGKGFQVKNFQFDADKCNDKKLHEALHISLSADYHCPVDHIGVIEINDPDGLKEAWAPKDADDIRQMMSAAETPADTGEQRENKPPMEDLKTASGAVLRAIVDQFELDIQKVQKIGDLRWLLVEHFYPDALSEL